MEEFVHGKDELDQPTSSAVLQGTTLYQVIFSMLIGISGWMYNFDLGEYSYCPSQKRLTYIEIRL